MSFGENWGKSHHHPGTKITTQSFQNFTPGWLALCFFNGNRNLIDHLNLSPAPYLVTCGSPSLLAACSGASCFRIGFQLLWPQVPVKMATAAAWQPHRVPGALDQWERRSVPGHSQQPITARQNSRRRFFSTPTTTGLHFWTNFTENFSSW